MKPDRASLEQIQRWMQSVITHPGGVPEGVESPAARAQIDVGLSELDSVIRPSLALESAERLEIYVDAYYQRLLECLAEEYAVTRACVGEDLFGALAFGYLQHYPSRSYTLHMLGPNFPAYLEESRLHAGQAPPDAPTWDRFIIELATFERLLHEVFDGPGSEEGPRFDVVSLQSAPVNTLGSARLTPNPSLRLAQFSHPVHEYWDAHKAGADSVVPSPRTTTLAVHRQDYRVGYGALSPLEFALLSRLVGGQSVGEAIVSVAQRPDSAAELEALPRLFAKWAQAGYFVGVEFEG